MYDRTTAGIRGGSANTLWTSGSSVLSNGSGFPGLRLHSRECHELDVRIDDRECDYFLSPTLLCRLIAFRKYDAACRRVCAYPREASVWVCTKRRIGTLPPGGTAKPPSGAWDPRLSGRSDQDRDEKKESSSSPTPADSEVIHNHKNDQENNQAIGGMVYYSRRMLPIHMACECLTRMGHSNNNDDDDDKGGGNRDDPNYRIRQSLETLLSQLVFYHPDGCGRRDHRGRLPLHEAVWNNVSPGVIGHLIFAAPHVALERDGNGRTVFELNQLREIGRAHV